MEIIHRAKEGFYGAMRPWMAASLFLLMTHYVMERISSSAAAVVLALQGSRRSIALTVLLRRLFFFGEVTPDTHKFLTASMKTNESRVELSYGRRL